MNWLSKFEARLGHDYPTVVDQSLFKLTNPQGTLFRLKILKKRLDFLFVCFSSLVCHIPLPLTCRGSLSVCVCCMCAFLHPQTSSAANSVCCPSVLFYILPLLLLHPRLFLLFNSLIVREK